MPEVITEAMYRKGKPPFVGWWPASIEATAFRVYRWWDGEQWSFCAHRWMTPEAAAEWASRKSLHKDIQWRYWLPGEDGGKLPKEYIA
jgi:hypothetical protein